MRNAFPAMAAMLMTLLFYLLLSRRSLLFQLIPTCTADLSEEAEITADDFNKMKRQNKM